MGACAGLLLQHLGMYRFWLARFDRVPLGLSASGAQQGLRSECGSCEDSSFQRGTELRCQDEQPQSGRLTPGTASEVEVQLFRCLVSLRSRLGSNLEGATTPRRRIVMSSMQMHGV